MGEAWVRVKILENTITIPLQTCPVLDTGTESSDSGWFYLEIDSTNLVSILKRETMLISSLIV
jgi:hypothetical protein